MQRTPLHEISCRFMRPTCIGIFAALAILLALFAPPTRAQQPDSDWPMYRHDLAGSGYSPLKQINTNNVTKLAQSWSLVLADRGGLEVTPIVVNGVMYLPATDRVLALDAATGKEIWHYDVVRAPTRGVAYWPGDKSNPARIIFTTFNRKMIALEASTG